MPHIIIRTNVKKSDDESKKIATTAGHVLAEAIKKQESYVMSELQYNASLVFGGSDEPCAVVEVKSIGRIDEEKNAHYTVELCRFVFAALDVKPERTYIQFTDFAGHCWAWNGNTFKPKE
mmetsp:Transcript_33176/g.81374  ORF Transcript_33176/g.81374 Transcript_33176/m.81374 type:complete len:120 (+) Transcript_33176:48-407(+)|eukprot:CAMPEP_0198309684 /NCGR_PEP_ID=MMETSP1450-20131203/1987_1 /TAXON_ID=753684 ORGANISM="Madagascaria erythrocladiodes, Strain CCMP3234" /NCGR_SAMPLE_ID=MMETSP1450 /ASSEMBLY_ACC=CAM_ASM_001115 /LENGTH=119 /DNA_ID=CAMNT_0044012451 /DNA_START=54 /DNA_END=413 /DNA_ORIENTATION=-